MINVIVSSRYKVNRKIIRNLAQEVLNKKGVDSDYIVNIVFVGKTKMALITNKYKNEQQALPVLSFPYHEINSDGSKILGEIFICYPLTIIMAAQRNKKVEDIINFLINHGMENLLK